MRATKDVDTLFRGDFEEFLSELDSALCDPWGVLSFQRSEITILEDVPKSAKPRRFDIRLFIRGKVWRRIQVEVSPDEGRAGVGVDVLNAPALSHFGLPTPDKLVGIALDYQVAQKLHACTDPHSPPGSPNNRVRDIVDLVLLRQNFYARTASLRGLADACSDVFQSRAYEAQKLGSASRSWPPAVVAFSHWEGDYVHPANQANLQLGLHEAIDLLNIWIQEISDHSVS
jgi:hypothetical protein